MTITAVTWPDAGWRLVCNGVVMGALLAGLGACDRTQPPAETIQAVKVQTVGVSPRVHAGEYAGVVAARTESRLGFRVAGKLTGRSVNVGDSVQAGQLLAQLDAQDYRLSAEAAQAQVTAATTQRDLAQADVVRYRALRNQNFISAAEMDRREAALKGAQAQLDQARAQLAAERNQAGYTRLVADADGVITGVDAEVGQVVAAGTPVVRLARDGERDAVFAVPEDRRGLFAVGTPVRVRVWASGEAIDGVVRELSASADAVSRTFSVKVALKAVGADLPALGSTVAVQLARAPSGAQAIKLPISALHEQTGITRVWVLDAATMQLNAREVQLLGMDENEVIVTSGVKPGEMVVVAGVHVLSEGQKVRIYHPKGDRQSGQPLNGVPSSAVPAPASSGAATSAPAASAAASSAQ